MSSESFIVMRLFCSVLYYARIIQISIIEIMMDKAKVDLNGAIKNFIQYK